MQLFSISLLIILTVFSTADESCRGECSTDGYPWPCGVWLKNETKLSSLGTYELNKGVAHLSCSFASLPNPVQIQWMFRAQGSSQWKEFPCAKKEETKNCQDSEIIVESNCVIRTNSLTMSGSYRCAAAIPNQSEHRYRAFSSEFPIQVTGIESPRVISSHLPINKNGHIDIEICANPRPEIFWHTSDGIIQPQDTETRFATTALTPRMIILDPKDPVQLVPYCYTTSILVHNVHPNDEFRLSIRGELATVHEKIRVSVKASSNLSCLFILPLITLIYIYLPQIY